MVTGLANDERAASNADAPGVTWKDARGTILNGSSASGGSKVVKDAETGRLRPARAGELPEVATGRPTEIIDSPDGSGIAVVGDDLLTESVAVKQPDGSVKVQWGHETGAQTPAEVK